MPRRDWTDQQKHKYEHITKSQKEQGKPADKAQEIAAKTIQKERSGKGQSES